MDANESKEDYLEKIYMLKQTQVKVRAIDIVKLMNFSKPSVSIALKKLIKEGYVTHDEKTGDINLTEEGYKIAESTYDRHITLANFFEYLGVEKSIALQDACKVEHDLSKDTYLKLKEYLSKLDL